MTRNHGLFCVHHLAELRGKPYMNFNLNMQVDKVMNKLSESKALRIWTYVVFRGLIVLVIIWKLAPILEAIAKILEVLK